MLEKSDLETNLQRIHEWIKAADQKVSIFLTFQGVVVTILFADIFSWVRENILRFSCLDFFLLISGIVLAGFSVSKSVTAIIPRLKNHSGKLSLTYFGDIAKLKFQDFKKKIKETNKEEFENELVEQIHISSIITARKHLQFRDAILTFFLGMFLLALSFVIFKVRYGN